MNIRIRWGKNWIFSLDISIKTWEFVRGRFSLQGLFCLKSWGLKSEHLYYRVWCSLNMMNSSPVPFAIGYQRPHYPMPDMLQSNAEITVIRIKSVYHVLGALLRRFSYSINPPIILGNRYYYHFLFIEEKNQSLGKLRAWSPSSEPREPDCREASRR